MRFSIGTDDFKKLRTGMGPAGERSFYCDKSLLIRDIIRDGASVLLFPRPRRFGKSLNLSMLQYFFGSTENLFEGLAIEQYPKILEGWRAKFPVVSLVFKNLKTHDLNELTSSLKASISDAYWEAQYLKDSEQLSTLDRQRIEPYFDPKFQDLYLTNSLLYLTQMLEKHHGQRVWVLIDEYDTPLQSAYLKGFFKPAAALFKNVLGAVLKTNSSLYKGVLTGITRIAKESLFSDLNNIMVYDITCPEYAQYFGFTESEVSAVCPESHLAELRSWYNGYRFGEGLTIYNPWSILHFLKKGYRLGPYWVNTSGNELIRDCITADKLKDIDRLLQHQGIAIPIQPYTVMDNLN